jgi:putative zinc finger protein
MNEHPEELLAAFVDGELNERDTRAVEAHVKSCARCADEIALAGRAVTALGALEDVPAPLGLSTRATQQARPVRPFAERLQWAAGIAAAAALIGIFAVIALRSNTADDLSSGRGAGGEAGPMFTPPAEGAGGAGGGNFVYTDADYTDEALQAMVRREAGVEDSGGGDGVLTSASTLSEAEIAAATECVERAGLEAQQGAVLIRVEAARYKGDPAYVVLFSRGDTIEVWVVDRTTCGIRYVATSRRQT